MHVNVNWIKDNIKQILVDQFVQNWEAKLQTLQEVIFIPSLKKYFCLEPYLLRIEKHRNCITKFIISNMKLPFKTGRWYHIRKDHRECTKCLENLIGGEFHYLFICSHPEIVNLRVRYIPNYYLRNSNAENMAGMLSLCHIELLTNLSRFLKGLIILFS